ncbi:hypothetical protein D3C80_1341610 [compost metagenome]
MSCGSSSCSVRNTPQTMSSSSLGSNTAFTLSIYLLSWPSCCRLWNLFSTTNAQLLPGDNMKMSIFCHSRRMVASLRSRCDTSIAVGPPDALRPRRASQRNAFKKRSPNPCVSRGSRSHARMAEWRISIPSICMVLIGLKRFR